MFTKRQGKTLVHNPVAVSNNTRPKNVPWEHSVISEDVGLHVSVLIFSPDALMEQYFN